jgi:phosphatidylethanolamine-binding protein (PEBP) family uncharacterized protein
LIGLHHVYTAPDPAAPRTTWVHWVHWVLFDIPPGADAIPEGGQPLSGGTREGSNDRHRTGYGGHVLAHAQLVGTYQKAASRRGG